MQRHVLDEHVRLLALGDVARRATIALEDAERIENRRAADGAVVRASLRIDEMIFEIPEKGRKRFEVDRVPLPSWMAVGVDASRLPARLAQDIGRSDPGAIMPLGNEAEPKLGIHLPQPVGGRREELLQALLALTEQVPSRLQCRDIGEHGQNVPDCPLSVALHP